MKKIALVSDDRFYWKYIESYLGGINADVQTFTPEATCDDLAGCGADLLILGTERIPSLSSPLRLFRTIVVHSDGDTLPEQTRASKQKILFLKWPVSKDRFLGETAAMLGVSPRKDFKALVRIFSPDAEHGIIGKSIDFSLTGMSFTAERHYSAGHQVSISLSTPNGNGKLVLDGRITRNWTNESDGAREYGVEFMNLPAGTVQALKEFILG